MYKRQGDTACVETAGGREERSVKIIYGYSIDRRVASVIDNAGFSRIRAVFVIIDAKPCLGGVVIDKIIIADSAETNPVFRIGADIICREFGDDPGPESEKRNTGNNIEFGAANLFLKGLPPYETFVAGRGEAEKDFSE